MNTRIAIAVMLTLAVITVAQTASNYSLQSAQGPLTGCQTPTAGTNTLCSGPDGWYAAAEAGTLTKIGAIGPAGAPGAVGATGAIGPIGPQGPAGPAGTILATLTCNVSTPATGGIMLSGCH